MMATHEALALTVGQMWLVSEIISVKRTKPKLTHESQKKKPPSDEDKCLLFSLDVPIKVSPLFCVCLADRYI